MMKHDTALLIIDMINNMNFDGGEDLLRNTLSTVDPILNLKTIAKEKGMPVIYVNDNFGLWQDNVDELVEECKKGRGKEVVELLQPEENDFFIIKPKHSGFFGTPLDILLNELQVKKLIITGVAGDICILFTANDAYMRGYDLWVPQNCIASESKVDNDNALTIIKRSTFSVIERSNNMNIDSFRKTTPNW
ncbi:isochorismatase family cysteine hydrolase [Aquibacillus rhizosphaerae]|uniref:Isochorismatase family cysteine hydrolase n=1 Tax=Aquibacillus rhizosphaerae TaxID=3051431 RepID=A0ABT7LBH3_9BACI|nr:isochorismatase family cysteine hydrolase [Aquibacillus sp. LR5S19]MDL4843203.1 isochorismatase family cysteine hydrolase [Aquibacillus sp. LR5S19]